MRLRLVSIGTLLLAFFLGPGHCYAQAKGEKKGRLKPEDIGEPKLSPEQLADFIDIVCNPKRANLQNLSETDVLIAKKDLQRWGQKAGPALNQLLSSKCYRSRAYALVLIGKLKNCQVAEQNLIKLFQSETVAAATNSEHTSQRREAAEILGIMRSKAALPVLLKALNDQSWLRIREGARLALGFYGRSALPDIINHYREAQKKNLDGVMVRVLLVLGQIGGDKAKKTLLEALDQSEGKHAISVRHHAANALGTLNDKTTVDALIKRLIKERDHYVQKSIVRSLTLITKKTFSPEAWRWENWWKQARGDFLKTKKTKLTGFEIPVPKVPKRKPSKKP
jgi:hypothetical protein